MRLSPGSRLGTYEVVGVIGAGGMGEVYEARDLRLGRKVALKVVAADSFDPNSVRRLEEEARAASVLNHPNIVTIYGVGEEGENTFFAMEFVQGTPLRALMEPGALPIARALDIAVQLAEAMAAAHTAGIIHRDLKPDNVLITEDGVAKVLDFGLARRRAFEDDRDQTQTALTKEGVILGTVGYMSPEQAAGRPLGPQSDQFSFGIIFYEMLSGIRPFRRPTHVETLAAIINERHEPIQSANDCVPAPLGQLVDRLLAKSPKHRFDNTRELAAQLRQMRAQSAAAFDYPRPPASEATVLLPASVSRRRVLWLGGAAAAAAAIAGAGAWRFWPAASGERSLAVLPFVNGGANPDSDYLSDGITESLIQRFSQIPLIKVKARSTVFGFKGKPIDPVAIAKLLKVDAVLTGTITQKGDVIVVSAELVDASGTRMWGQNYQRSASGFLPLQDEIATAVVNEGFDLRPSPNEGRELTRKPTNNPEAYELYLRARHQFMFETEEAYVAARELAERAVKLDPRFAQAYVTIGSTYTVLAIDGFTRPTDTWPAASRNFSKALEIDPGISDARFGAADQAFFFDWDFDEAERIWQGIIKDPRGIVDPDWFRPRALRFWALGQPDKALEAIRLARQLDPVAVGLRVSEGDYLLYSNQFDAAIAKYEEVIHDDPIDPRAYFGLSEAYFRKRQFDDAIASRRDAERIAGNPALDEVLARAKGEAGFRTVEREAAKLEIADLTDRNKSGSYVSPLDFARAFAQLSEVEQAFKYFPAAFADRAPGLVFLNVDRAWDAVRTELRFVAAVKQVGLPMVSSPL